MVFVLFCWLFVVLGVCFVGWLVVGCYFCLVGFLVLVFIFKAISALTPKWMESALSSLSHTFCLNFDSFSIIMLLIPVDFILGPLISSDFVVIIWLCQWCENHLEQWHSCPFSGSLSLKLDFKDCKDAFNNREQKVPQGKNVTPTSNKTNIFPSSCICSHSFKVV